MAAGAEAVTFGEVSEADDIERAVGELAARLPDELAPLARLAYDYRWSWAPDGPGVFEAIDADRWRRVGENPVRLLSEASPASLERAVASTELQERIAALAGEVDADLARPPADAPSVAFLCAEFAVHRSLPIYSGGLGVLAGDILKEASDQALPMVGVGLLYRTGYFHQRLDTTGYQHEYWVDSDPDRLPAVPLDVRVTVPVDDEDVVAQVWRVDVGRVPLYLLDTDLPENSTVGRWITSRLYERIASVRLAQYAVLGYGGALALEALGIEPEVFHVNEGHPILATARLLERSGSWDAVRERVVFTTHTPVPAGNETYSIEEARQMLGRLPRADDVLERAELDGRVGMSTLALRTARNVNGVSRRHGEVAREMWKDLGVDIGHVTNGVHVPTWLGPDMRELLDRYLGPDWRARAADPVVWQAVDQIPDDELWAARSAGRRRLVEFIRERSADDRLRRGEELEYAEAAAAGFHEDRLTIGFARRLAAYKRLHLLTLDPDRALGVLDHVQFVFAGKAHPLDEGAKQILKRTFELKSAPAVADRVAFLEDYDLGFADVLMAGADVWINVPRPPEEASGTSGMKAALNGALNLSVLDGWWAEAYDGENGWAVDGSVDDDAEALDARHSAALYDLLEQEVVPLYADRAAWLTRVRASLKTNGPRFSAARMVGDYVGEVYPLSR